MPAATWKPCGRLSRARFSSPGQAGYDQARQAWNLAVDQRPAAIALPESAHDVAVAVGFAREHGLRVAAQGTGHNAGPLGDLADTVLIKTHAMRKVMIDPAAMVATPGRAQLSFPVRRRGARRPGAARPAR